MYFLKSEKNIIINLIFESGKFHKNIFLYLNSLIKYI